MFSSRHTTIAAVWAMTVAGVDSKLKPNWRMGHRATTTSRGMSASTKEGI